jgi:hypothetical protein
MEFESLSDVVTWSKCSSLLNFGKIKPDSGADRWPWKTHRRIVGTPICEPTQAYLGAWYIGKGQCRQPSGTEALELHEITRRRQNLGELTVPMRLREKRLTKSFSFCLLVSTVDLISIQEPLMSS